MNEFTKNEFTKEELEKLRDGLNYAVGNPYGFTADSISPLYNKIKSMIEHYCEHVWTDGSGNNIFCSKCHIHAGKR